MKYNYKQILEAIGNGISLSLDDFEDQDVDIQTQSYAKVKDTGKGFIQKIGHIYNHIDHQICF